MGVLDERNKLILDKEKYNKMNFLNQVSLITTASLCKELKIDYSNFKSGRVSKEKLNEMIELYNYKIAMISQYLDDSDF